MRTAAETILVEQETARRPRQQPGKSKASTGTRRDQKETANKETGPWAETGTCPRKGQMTEPKGMPRMSTANEIAGRWRPTGTKPERTQREQPVRHHALPIALSPDGQYVKPGEPHWESEEMTKETRCRNKALRDTAEAGDTSGRMYIDVDVPGGREEDGAPHWGYVVTAPHRGNRFQLWCPVHLQCTEQSTEGAANGRGSPCRRWRKSWPARRG